MDERAGSGLSNLPTETLLVPALEHSRQTALHQSGFITIGLLVLHELELTSFRLPTVTSNYGAPVPNREALNTTAPGTSIGPKMR